MSTLLSVNINKVATLRNARGGNIPDVVRFACDCERYGADGITVHPRPDERHIRYSDVRALKKVLKKPFNIEGFPDESFLNLVHETLPEQVTLVPDPPGVLTSNAGWNVYQNREMLREIVHELKRKNIRTSIFIDPDEAQLEYVPYTGTDRVELYTESYSSEFETAPEKAIFAYKHVAMLAFKRGIGLNAGHDLNLRNLKFFAQNIQGLLEVSIGHALISDALYYGIQNTIHLYKRCIAPAHAAF